MGEDSLGEDVFRRIVRRHSLRLIDQPLDARNNEQWKPLFAAADTVVLKELAQRLDALKPATGADRPVEQILKTHGLPDVLPCDPESLEAILHTESSDEPEDDAPNAGSAYFEPVSEEKLHQSGLIPVNPACQQSQPLQKRWE